MKYGRGKSRISKSRFAVSGIEMLEAVVEEVVTVWIIIGHWIGCLM